MCLVGSNGPSSNPTWLAAVGNPLKKKKPVSTFFPLQLGIYQPGQAGATLRGRPVWGSQRISSTSSLSVLPFSLAQSTPWCWSKAHGEADQKDQQMTRFQDLLGKSVELVSISIMFEVTIIYIYIFTCIYIICDVTVSAKGQKILLWGHNLGHATPWSTCGFPPYYWELLGQVTLFYKRYCQNTASHQPNGKKVQEIWAAKSHSKHPHHLANDFVNALVAFCQPQLQHDRATWRPKTTKRFHHSDLAMRSHGFTGKLPTNGYKYKFNVLSIKTFKVNSYYCHCMTIY